jgi:hypothetical protein
LASNGAACEVRLGPNHASEQADRRTAPGPGSPIMRW